MDFFLNSYTNMFFAAIAVISGVALLWQTLSGRGVSHISTMQASTMIGARAQVIDVREVEDFATGHIKNAKSLPLSQIKVQLPLLKLKKDKPVIVVCTRGTLSAKAARTLVGNDFTDVHILDGGLRAWAEAQLPIVKN